MKADLITGFLGAGKTTFLKYYTRWLTSQGIRVGILVNDHGAVNVDVLLLDELRSDLCDVEMVSAACGYDMHRLRFKTKLIQMAMAGAYDRLLVEPSGVFDVDEFFDLLYESPLDRWYERGSVIAIVDARPGLQPSGPDGGPADARGCAGTLSRNAPAEDAAKASEESEYLLMTQTANAGLVVLSRVQELASAADIPDAVSRTAARINRAMERFSCDRRIRESEILAKNWDDLTASDWQRVLRSEYRGADHIKLPVDRENRFSSVFYMKEQLRMTETELRALAEELLSGGSRKTPGDPDLSGFPAQPQAPAADGIPACGRVLRVKGTVLSPEGVWLEVNAAGPDVSIRKAETGQDILIIVGEDLEKEALDRRVRIYCSTERN